MRGLSADGMYRNRVVLISMTVFAVCVASGRSCPDVFMTAYAAVMERVHFFSRVVAAAAVFPPRCHIVFFMASDALTVKDLLSGQLRFSAVFPGVAVTAPKRIIPAALRVFVMTVGAVVVDMQVVIKEPALAKGSRSFFFLVTAAALEGAAFSLFIPIVMALGAAQFICPGMEAVIKKDVSSDIFKVNADRLSGRRGREEGVTDSTYNQADYSQEIDEARWLFRKHCAGFLSV